MVRNILNKIIKKILTMISIIENSVIIEQWGYCLRKKQKTK